MNPGLLDSMAAAAAAAGSLHRGARGADDLVTLYEKCPDESQSDIRS